MRTITVKHEQNHAFINDWNFRQWALTKNTDGTLFCTDIPGVKFASVDAFIRTMYGIAFILSDGGEKIAFRNYYVETILSNN